MSSSEYNSNFAFFAEVKEKKHGFELSSKSQQNAYVEVQYTEGGKNKVDRYYSQIGDTETVIYNEKTKHLPKVFVQKEDQGMIQEFKYKVQD